MKIRIANTEDLPYITKLYKSAKAVLNSRGINQWQDGYPNEASAVSDISSGSSYVLEEGGSIIGTAFIGFGTEPTYEKIYEGRWMNENTEYVFVHRVAVDINSSGKGLALEFFRHAEEIAKKHHTHSIRCDTHKDNIPMQKTLERNGFIKCGIILLEDNSQRLAYEKLI